MQIILCYIDNDTRILNGRYQWLLHQHSCIRLVVLHVIAMHVMALARETHYGLLAHNYILHVHIAAGERTGL